MGASTFQAGAIVSINGKKLKLLRLLDNSEWQLEEDLSKRILEFRLLDLEKLYVKRELIFVSSLKTAAEPVSTSGMRRTYSDEQWELAKIRRMYVVAIEDLPSTRQCIAPIVKETWGKVQRPDRAPDVATVIRWKKRFRDAGRDITALIDPTHRKGNRASRYPSEVVAYVHDAIELKYMCLERGTIQDVVDDAKVKTIRENELRPLSNQLPLPTFKLASRMVYAIPAFERVAARYGPEVARKRFRAVLGHRTTHAALEFAAVDHSLLDLLVVDDATGLPMGRPWLTVCIDEHTRCILGMFISFEPPSYFTVARCLRNAFMPKVNLASDFPSIANSWYPHGVMTEVIVDNGPEFHSVSLENACYSVGLEITYAPRKVPWFKGKVERFLGTLNRAIAHGTSGTTFSNILEKSEYDSAKHAIVSYSVLMEVAHLWVVDVYHQKRHRAIGISPAKAWATSISQEQIPIPGDPALLDAILGSSVKRRLTHSGIDLHGLRYNSVELTDLRKRLGDSLDVEVRFDSSDLGRIIVFAPDSRQFYQVEALNFEYAGGLTAWQHKVIKRFASREFEDETEEGWLKAKAKIAELIDNEFMKRNMRSRTRIARYKGKQGLPPAQPSVAVSPRSYVIESSPPPAATAETIYAESPEQASTLVGSRKVFKPIVRERPVQFSTDDTNER